MKQSLFYYAIAGFLVGIVIHSVFSITLSHILLLTLISGSILVAGIKKSKVMIIGCVIVFSAGIGLARYEFFIQWNGDESLTQLVDKKIEGEGVIVEEPAIKEKYTKLIVALDTVNGQKITPTKILVQDGVYSERNYGDRILVEGKLSLPKNFEKEGERTFDYVSYLRKDKIFYEVKYAKVTLISSKQGNKIMHQVYALKDKATGVIREAISFPESTLASGIIIAGKGGLPKHIQEEFQKTGTIQVVVLSGSNVTIVSEVIILLCAQLPRIIGVSVSIVMIVLFALAAGGSATIMRAVVMVIVALGAKLVRRDYDVGRALLISGIVMLLFNPMLLIYDPSFQLSFLATIGLIYATPVVSAKILFIPERWGLRELCAAGIATQIFLTPFLIYLTGEVSLVSVPANLAVGLLVPISMLFSFLTAISGLVSHLIAMPFGIIAFMFLKAMLTVVHFFAIIPFASLSLGSLPLWVVALCYMGFTLIIVRFNKNLPHPPSAPSPLLEKEMREP